jgi:hypothetical protein
MVKVKPVMTAGEAVIEGEAVAQGFVCGERREAEVKRGVRQG